MPTKTHLVLDTADGGTIEFGCFCEDGVWVMSYKYHLAPGLYAPNTRKRPRDIG